MMAISDGYDTQLGVKNAVRRVSETRHAVFTTLCCLRMSSHLKKAARVAERVVMRFNYQLCTRERTGVITALVDNGCRWSRAEIQTIAARCKGLSKFLSNRANAIFVILELSRI